ncbi:MAG: class I SAM-dependent methyltransferase [Magnetococcales bacterium]|nr:class I SAM-dependent methyltransferase [Magnetococcales bacterium]
MAGVHCRICTQPIPPPPLRVREMMFGLEESFDYHLCPHCQCLQIGTIPGDLSPYYPPGYYSYAPVPQPGSAPFQRLRRLRDRATAAGRSPWQRLLRRLAPSATLADLSPLDLHESMAVLELGCGSGARLHALAACGFTRLLGIDPFLPSGLEQTGPVTLRRTSLAEVSGVFHLIMLHHTFEHLPDPRDTLAQIARRLHPGGWCLIRIPVVPSLAWHRYREHWAQLDAPRHLHLFSTRSMQILARDSGLTLERVRYDSGSFQFWASEQYARGIPLQHPDSWSRGNRSLFSPADMRRFRRLARHCNRRGEGDQAVFSLRRPG